MKLIDKTEALTAIANEIRELHNEDAIVVGEKIEEIGLITAFDIIKRLPIVEERPKGKWRRGKIDNKDVWYCSNCKHIDDYYGPTANYCWYCGADMRGDENE